MPQKNIFLLFFKTAAKYPIRASSVVIATTIGTIITAFAGPLVIAQLLDNIQNGVISFDDNLNLIILYTIVQVYTQIINMRLTIYLIWTLSITSQRDLSAKIFKKLNSQSMSFHADRFGGALVSQSTKLTSSYDRFLDIVIFNIIPTIVGILGATIILAFILWQYAVVLFAASLLFAALVIFGSKFLAARSKEESKANTLVNGHIADSITNIMTIKSHGSEREELASLQAKTDTWREKSFSNMRGFLAITTGYSTVTAGLNIAAIIAAIWAVGNGALSVGLVYLCLTYTLNVTRQLWEISSIMRGIYRIIGDAHEMTEILELEPSIIDASSRSIKVSRGEIDFTNMSFAHEDDRSILFNNFNQHIAAGEKIGLVGHSGSGKTTLTKLLLRFSDVTSGSITIDGQNITDCTQESLRRAVAYVPQEPMLFHRSLRENIAYGKPDATDEEIYEAAKQANALEFIEKLPQKLATTVGERGVKLSGGQRQRVAIARAILKDAPILILDEATSALDSESEKLIQDALEKLMKGRTSIVIAHRLSTIAKLDRIIVLDNGTIAEQGTHDELLAQKGTYASLWNHQSGGFIEE